MSRGLSRSQVGVGVLAWSTTPRRLTPEERRPETGNGIYVSALPN